MALHVVILQHHQRLLTKVDQSFLDVKEGIGHESSKLNSSAFGRRSGDKHKIESSQKEAWESRQGLIEIFETIWVNTYAIQR